MKTKDQLAREDAVRQQAIQLAAADGISLGSPGAVLDVRIAKTVVKLYEVVNRRKERLEAAKQMVDHIRKDFNAKSIAEELGISRGVLSEEAYAAIIEVNRPTREKTVLKESYDALKREMATLREWQKGEATRVYKYVKLQERCRLLEHENTQKDDVICKLHNEIDEINEVIDALMPAGHPLREYMKKNAMGYNSEPTTNEASVTADERKDIQS